MLDSVRSCVDRIGTQHNRLGSEDLRSGYINNFRDTLARIGVKLVHQNDTIAGGGDRDGATFLHKYILSLVAKTRSQMDVIGSILEQERSCL